MIYVVNTNCEKTNMWLEKLSYIFVKCFEAVYKLEDYARASANFRSCKCVGKPQFCDSKLVYLKTF